jgi:hypothetical protein
MAPAGDGNGAPVLCRRAVGVFESDGIQPPILNILVPQTGQTPWVAGLPFFIVILVASFISRFALHLTQ